MNGSIQAVLASGLIAMSDLSMDFQPRILDPSNGTPSVAIFVNLILVYREVLPRYLGINELQIKFDVLS